MSNVHIAPEGTSRAGERIVAHHEYPPIPIRDFDWQAYFDNDEPDDDGHMLTGNGPTEQEAIDDLLMKTED